jgi:hypothetical protein
MGLAVHQTQQGSQGAFQQGKREAAEIAQMHAQQHACYAFMFQPSCVAHPSMAQVAGIINYRQMGLQGLGPCVQVCVPGMLFFWPGFGKSRYSAFKSVVLPTSRFLSGIGLTP